MQGRVDVSLRLVRSLSVALVAVLLLVAALFAVIGRADATPAPQFQRTWERTDAPVANGIVNRTWMWGASVTPGPLQEPYAQAPGGMRTVQYFDKSRMEITDPSADASSPWYVTNGLLVIELISGQLQLGDATFEEREPAQVNVAGDPDDPDAPTYASFGSVVFAPAYADGEVITRTIDRSGTIAVDATLAAHGVRAAYRVQQEGLDHQVASPFWAFMNATGVVLNDGAYVSDTLFINPFYATGFPVTEAYWTDVKVAGSQRTVLVQCFERRCLTYTPDNPDGWQVEAGNVGQHYYAWRYGVAENPPWE